MLEKAIGPATIASLDIGMGNIIANHSFLRGIRGVEHQIITNSPTKLAELRQIAMTILPGGAAEYTANQTKYRESPIARMLALASTLQLLAKTPKLRPGSHETRSLIATSEFFFYFPQLLTSRFTNFYLLAADVEPKPSAQKIIDQSHSSRMPITPIVWAKSTHDKIQDSILVKPWIITPSTGPNTPNIAFLKESGTGMNLATEVHLLNTLRQRGRTVKILDSNRATTTITPNGHSHRISPQDILTHYDQMALAANPIFGTYPSEMVMLIAILAAQEVHLAEFRGSHEKVNGDWLAQFYEIFAIAKPWADPILHLRQRSDTKEALYAAVGHDDASHVLAQHLNRN